MKITNQIVDKVITSSSANFNYFPLLYDSVVDIPCDDGFHLKSILNSQQDFINTINPD